MALRETLRSGNCLVIARNVLIANTMSAQKTEYVENWEQIQLESERVERRATRADMNEQRERIVDLISANSTVAIASGDVDEDNYLLKVSGNGPEVLSRSTKGDWGSKYKSGVEVLRGHFYVKEALGQHVYQLVTDRR